MAVVRLTRQALEALSQAPDYAKVGKQAIEAAVDNSAFDAAAAVRLTRQGVEVVRSQANTAKLNKQSLEVAVDNSAFDAAAAVLVTRQAAEVLRQNPNFAKVVKLSLEAAVDNAAFDAAARVRLTRQGAEVLSRRGPAAIVPLDDPDPFFLFPHNWSDAVTMRTAYLTDIDAAQESTAEERRALLARPTRKIRFSWLQNEPEWLVRLMSTLRKVPNSRLTLPLYQDQMELTAGGAASATLFCETGERRLTVGQRVGIVKLDPTDHSRAESVDLRRVLGIDPTFITLDSPTSFALDPSDTLVFPMIDTEINLEAGMGMPVRRAGVVELELTEVLGPSSLLPTATGYGGFQLFEGKPIWKFGHNWSDKLSMRFVRDGRIFTQGRGEIVDPQGARHRTEFKYRLGPVERADFWRILQFFDASRGRCRSFWIPDPENNYTVLASAGAGAFVDVDPLGEFEDFTAEMDYVVVILKDGTHIPSQVVNIEETLGVWRITLADPQTFTASDVERIARLRLVRFGSDELVEKWSTTNAAEVSFELLELLAEGEVTL